MLFHLLWWHHTIFMQYLSILQESLLMFGLGHEFFSEPGPKKASISNSKMDAFVKLYWTILAPLCTKIRLLVSNLSLFCQLFLGT